MRRSIACNARGVCSDLTKAFSTGFLPENVVLQVAQFAPVKSDSDAVRNVSAAKPHWKSEAEISVTNLPSRLKQKFPVSRNFHFFTSFTECRVLLKNAPWFFIGKGVQRLNAFRFRQSVDECFRHPKISGGRNFLIEG